MFILYANKNQLTIRKKEPVTSGSVNVYTVHFEFSPDWDGLTLTAVFRAGAESRSVLLTVISGPSRGNRGMCIIPWEVLKKHGVQLQVGVYGARGGEVVLPTIWAGLGTILEGTTTGQAAQPPTPDLWEQELAGKGDRLDITPDGDVGLYAGDKLLSAVPVQGGGGEGTSDHRLLSHRDADGQHPIASIKGLSDELDRIPEPVEALSNIELEALLK